MIDLPPQVTRIAAFDFGSNATKCAIAELDNIKVNYLAEFRIQTRLGASMDTEGKISETAIHATVEAAVLMMQHCRDLGVTKYLAVGTEALRKAANSATLIEELRQQAGLVLRVISAEEEAELSWKGMLTALDNPHAEILLFDSGGASTELIYGRDTAITSIQSLPLGAVTLTRDFIHNTVVSDSDYLHLLSHIDSAIDIRSTGAKLVMGSGGGITACAKVAIANAADLQTDLHNYFLSSTELNRQISLYRSCTTEQRKQIPGMESERADIILASAMIALTILNATQAQGLHVCTRGVRHGLISRLSTQSAPAE